MVRKLNIVLLLIINLIYGQIPNYWSTYFEKSNFLETPRYSETIEYFNKLDKHSEFGKIISIGKSAEGRDIYIFIASKDKAFTSRKAKLTGKPIIFIQNGIHAGEIDGKDASMLLLREILVTKEKFHFLDDMILVIMPIFNVDGHERFSPYNRINQNGPEEMGWRTNAQNLNLNRDYMKADSPEMKVWLKFFNEWLPQVFIDCHVTNGADYQYELTYSSEKHNNVHPILGHWIKNEFIPFLELEMSKAGYKIAPYMWFRGDEVEKGIIDGITPPRFSTGYVALHNRITLLIETHMLKDYKTRVFATKEMIEAVLKKVSQERKNIIDLIEKVEKLSLEELVYEKKYLPIRFQTSQESEKFTFFGYKYNKVPSIISGKDKIVHTNEKIEMEIPLYNKHITIDSVNAPPAYLIPPAYSNLVDILKLHGIKSEKIRTRKKFIVEKYKFSENTTWQRRPFEGRIQVNTTYEIFQDTVIIPTGYYYINPYQKNIKVLMHLLEPKSSDSFVAWGFFNSIFERKEYYEDYVMEKIAEEMYNSNEKLRIEFENKIKADSLFANNPNLRLEFFYRNSPYFDKEWLVYPVMRVVKILE